MDRQGIEFVAQEGGVPEGCVACRPQPCVLVIFGGTGDLAQRKLIPALYNLAREGALPEHLEVLGFSRSARSTQAYRQSMREAVGRFSRTQPIDESTWNKFESRLHTVAGSLDDPTSYETLKREVLRLDEQIGAQQNRIFYFATPPAAFSTMLRHLSETGLIRRSSSNAPAGFARVVIEKPFGHDVASARELNELANQYLDENQIYRIDHYLGKETVQNILVFRFGNAIFEPIWNRKYIDHVEITAAEEVGVEGRGKFYDGTGVVRDIVQNHLLQVLALCAMEQPVSFSAEEIRSEKSKVFRSMRELRAEDAVHAQYEGYCQEEGVSSTSRTPTFTAMRVLIDNWRWQGVPFYLRAGKRLAKRITEVSIHFHAIPHCLFGNQDICQLVQPNVLSLRIQPDEGITLHFATKVPGDELNVGSVTMDFSYARAFDKQPHEAYERLLLDCMRGDQTLFARGDVVELSWQAVSPVIKAWEETQTEVPTYKPGSTGPREADELLSQDGRTWRPLR